jgi:hypothetical protein
MERLSPGLLATVIALNGKQYVVLAIGGQRYPAELVALSLP